jgi:hypothetical protein
LILAERLLAIHEALDRAGVEHAFGGAIALAYWTEEPRGTRDIDINIFVAPEDCETVLSRLPVGVSYDERTIATIIRDGQARLLWGDTPVDLFFSSLPIHDEAARHRQVVVFEGEEIPVLGPLELALFKAMFDRTRDWGDIEEMLAARSLDPDALRKLIGDHVDDDDLRFVRLDEALTRTRQLADGDTPGGADG